MTAAAEIEAEHAIAVRSGMLAAADRRLRRCPACGEWTLPDTSRVLGLYPRPHYCPTEPVCSGCGGRHEPTWCAPCRRCGHQHDHTGCTSGRAR